MQDKQRSAFFIIVGVPNVGKSSILNKLLGQKLSIVSPKPQTTRTRVTGILTMGSDQLVFIDTPGFHSPKSALGNYMVAAVNTSIPGADAALLVVDCSSEIRSAERALIEKLSAARMPVILAVNKIDTLRHTPDKLLEAIAAYSQLYDFEAVVPVSAHTGEGFDALKEEMLKLCQESVHFFPDDSFTDQPERVIASELIREKILRICSDEVPHGIAVVIESMSDRDDADILDIEATIYCERKSHKRILIGSKGDMIKRISTEARKDIERFFGCKVNLQTWVKVKENWRNRPDQLLNFGYNKKDLD